MLKQTIFYLILFTLFQFPIFINSADDFESNDYEAYGPTFAANDKLIIAIQNRTGLSFSAVSNYTSTSAAYCSLTYNSTAGSDLYVTMLAIGRNGAVSLSNSIFVFIAYSINNDTTYLYVASIDFFHCKLNILNETIVSNTTYPSYSVLGVTYDATMAFYLSDSYIFMQSLSSPYNASNLTSIKYPSSYATIPVAIDLQDTWGILAAFTQQSSSSTFKPTIYLINLVNCSSHLNSSCFIFQRSSLLSYSASWQSLQAPPNNVINNNYNSLYVMTISTNDNNNVLIGVQSINTVFRYTAYSTSLTFIGSRFLGTVPSIGFGKGVGWLDNTTAAILLNNFTVDYIQWRSSVMQLYSITSSSSLSNSISPYSSFPNSRQQLCSQLNGRLISMLANPRSGSLIYMDYYGNVQVILPSIPAYYTYTEGCSGQTNNIIYISPTLQCPSGTIKNLTASGKDLFRYCVLCAEGSFYSSNSSSHPNQCLPCNTTTQFCPWGAVAALPISVLDTISQAQVYPETPENDEFEDILLINMFNADFSSNCLTKQPLFFAIIIVGIGCLVLVFMGILKLTGKCKKQRRMIKKIFRQTDLIGEGELWIGGVASFAIVVISVFAYRFSNGFINEYPIETAPDATFACDLTLRNAKFSTSMQSLGIPLPEEEQTLFDMLDNQTFTLNIAFINTDFSAQNLTVSKVAGSIITALPRTTQETTGMLEASTNLTTHSTTIAFNVSSNSAVGAVRVGLTGPSMVADNYYVQELNFSYAFNYSNRTLTQNPLITVQLVKLINATEPLSSNGNTQYSALWIPTFIVNDDQLFYTESDFQLYHVLDSTVLTVEITEATYYIYNEQQPITKVTEVIFTDILFTIMCIELFALAFLFYKLAISPIIKAILSLCTDPNKIKPKRNGGPGCRHCRSVNAEALPAYRLPIQRIEKDTHTYPIRRQTSDIAHLHTMSTPAEVFH